MATQAVTLRIVNATSMTDLQMNAQSIFFILPIELRCEIYRKWLRAPEPWKEKALKALALRYGVLPYASTPGTRVELLCVCKAILRECYHIFLQTSTFYVRSRNGSELPMVLEPSLMGYIRHLQWVFRPEKDNEACRRSIEQATNAKTLHIHIECSGYCNGMYRDIIGLSGEFGGPFVKSLPADCSRFSVISLSMNSEADHHGLILRASIPHGLTFFDTVLCSSKFLATMGFERAEFRVIREAVEQSRPYVFRRKQKGAGQDVIVNGGLESN